MTRNKLAVDHHAKSVRFSATKNCAGFFEDWLRIVWEEVLSEGALQRLVLRQGIAGDLSPANAIGVVAKRDDAVAERTNNFAACKKVFQREAYFLAWI